MPGVTQRPPTPSLPEFHRHTWAGESPGLLLKPLAPGSLFKPKESDSPGEGCFRWFCGQVNVDNSALGSRKIQRLCSKFILAVIEIVQEIIFLIAKFSGKPEYKLSEDRNYLLVQLPPSAAPTQYRMVLSKQV